MTSAAVGSSTKPVSPNTSGLDWGLIARQIAGILRLELRRNLLSRRSFGLYFLAFSPVGLFVIWALSPATEVLSGPAEAVAQVFAPIFGGFPPIFLGYLPTIIFLSALITFMSLFRSEILEHSLHYYYLTPVRRWVLVTGKYCSALISACCVFSVSTTLLFLLICIPFGLGDASQYILQGPGLGYLTTYIGLAIMACIGYGAVFLLLGLFFRNAIVPAAFIWAWESINFILPSLLQKISVIHYIRTLYPIPLPEGWLAVTTDATSPWMSVPGLLIFTALVLTFAGWRAGRMEVNYEGD